MYQWAEKWFMIGQKTFLYLNDYFDIFSCYQGCENVVLSLASVFLWRISFDKAGIILNFENQT